MKLSLILEAIDKATAPVRKVERGVERLARGGLGKLEGAMRRIDQVEKRVLNNGFQTRLTSFVHGAQRLARGGFGRLEGAMRRVDQVEKRVLGSGFRERLVSFEHRMERLVRIGGRWALEKGAVAAGSALGWVTGKVIGLTIRLTALAAAGAIGSVVTAFGLIARGAIAVGMASEDAQLRLSRLTGSTQKAARELDWLGRYSISATTNNINDLTDAFITLRGAGLDPKAGWIRSIDALSAYNRRSIVELAEATRDAVRGDYGGLGGFNISAAKSKGMVTFTWLDQEGKRRSRSITDNAQKVKEALKSIYDEIGGPSQEGRIRSFRGMLNMLSNFGTYFEKLVADAGVYDVIKNKLRSAMEYANMAAEDGSLARWAEKISAYLTDMVAKASAFASSERWTRLTHDIHDLADALKGLLAFLDAIKQKGDQAAGVLNTIRDRMNAWADFQRKFLPVNGFAMIGMARDAYHDLFPGKPKVRPVPSAPRSRAGIDKAWRQALGPGGGSPTARGAWDQAIRNPKPTKIQIDVKAAPGLIASPARIDRGDADLDLYTGRAMQGF